MGTANREPSEWIDGFLFVANRPILDFLNTKPVLADGPTELLGNVDALERWFVAAGIVSSATMKAIGRDRGYAKEATTFLTDLISFRERLREAVVRIESGSTPSEAFLHEVNVLLMEHPMPTALRREGGRVVREMIFEPKRPSDFWAPIGLFAADLLSEPERSRVRRCESCVLHFFDTSRKGSRRWCSMNICGNKIKVAAYQRRKREQRASAET
jgi:predicted RNA-binding Zn ribbon-like protein